MRFDTLASVSTEQTYNAMMDAFSDYIIPIKMTLEQFEMKLKRDNIVADFSPCAVEGHLILGFNLLGLGDWNGALTVYDGATGVVPAARGNNLTSRLFDHIMPNLKKAEVKQFLLEVIIGNDAATHVYTKKGFKQVRDLICYQGEFNADHTLPEGFSFMGIANPNWEEMEAWHDWVPSWQNSIASTRNIQDRYAFIGVIKEEKLVAYITVFKETGYVAQFAVDPEFRRKGLGTKLFSFTSKFIKKPLAIINVDADATVTNQFLTNIGATETLRQHEMILPL